MRLKRCLFILPVLFCLLIAIPSNAASKGAVKSDGMDQVDGISSRIVDNLWLETDRYWHKGDYPRIVALDRIIAEAEPHFIMCFTNGGYLMDSLDRREDAAVFYKKGISNNPTSSDIYYSLGMFYFVRQKDYKSALATFKSDIKNCQPSINDYKMLAHCYEKLNDYKTAYSTWQAIKKIWPNGPAVDFNLNRVKTILAKSGANN